jgi:hypothetical protein
MCSGKAADVVLPSDAVPASGCVAIASIPPLASITEARNARAPCRAAQGRPIGDSAVIFSLVKIDLRVGMHSLSDEIDRASLLNTKGSVIPLRSRMTTTTRRLPV